MAQAKKKQATAASTRCKRRSTTRRRELLKTMKAIIPWELLVACVRPHYDERPGRRGRPRYPLEWMLRIHCLQRMYNFGDERVVEELHEQPSMRKFVGIGKKKPIPDESSVLRFRQLLERQEVYEAFFEEVNAYLAAHGLYLKVCTVLDSTLLAASGSTKNQAKQRDPEMHSTRKGTQYDFGGKAHIGMDADTGTVHTVKVTPANMHDLNMAKELLHGEEQHVRGDSAYVGIEKRGIGGADPPEFHPSMRHSKRRQLGDSPADQALEAAERRNASIRAKVEHAFRIVKCQFNYRSFRYRGLAKNTAHVTVVFALANLYQHRKVLAGV